MIEHTAYTFNKNCPSFSRDELCHINNLAGIRNNNKLINEWIKNICFSSSKHFKIDLDVSFLNASMMKKKYLSDYLSIDDIVVHFFYPNMHKDIYLLFHKNIARWFISRLLNDLVPDEENEFLFSATEKGILSYIIARILLSSSVKVKILGIYSIEDEEVGAINLDHLSSFDFNISENNVKYDAFLLLDSDLIKQVHHQEFVNKHVIRNYGHIHYPLKISLKTIMLSLDELRNLSLGDIILFENSKIKFFNNSLTGTIEGLWGNFVLAFTLNHRDKNYLIKFEGPLKKENLEEEQMENITENQSVKSGESLKDLVSDLKISLRVEIASLQMSLKDISALNVGSIIELEKMLDEPLDLVIQGKNIGKCQPVEIDGRLGVRILSIKNYEQ